MEKYATWGRFERVFMSAKKRVRRKQPIYDSMHEYIVAEEDSRTTGGKIALMKR